MGIRYNYVSMNEQETDRPTRHSAFWFRKIMLYVTTLLIIALIVTVSLQFSDKVTKTNTEAHNENSYVAQSYFEKNETIYFHKDTLKNDVLVEEQLQEDYLCHYATDRLYENEKNKCLGPPYIYLTYHGGFGSKDIRTVCKYSRDGCSFGSALLRSNKYHPRSLRGLTLIHDQMFVAESWLRNSSIILYSECNQKVQNKREFLKILANGENAPELQHPYGFTINPNDENFIYVSNQGSNLVLRFRIRYTKSHNKIKVQLEDPMTIVSFGEDQIRGITFDDQNRLYIANKDKGVMVFHANGKYIHTLSHGAEKPISVYYSHETKSLWVGSKSSHKVYEYNLTDWSVIKKIKHKKLLHPAGILVYKNSLFVVAQKTNQLLRFSTKTGKLIQAVLPSLRDDGERIILSPC